MKLVYTNNEPEKDNDSAPPTTKLQLPILNVTRCPLDRLPSDITAEFMENENQTSLDNNFRSFCAPTTKCYEIEVQQKQLLYEQFGSSSQPDNFVNGPSDFVGVSSLDILQGVGQGK